MSNERIKKREAVAIAVSAALLAAVLLQTSMPRPTQEAVAPPPAPAPVNAPSTSTSPATLPAAASPVTQPATAPAVAEAKAVIDPAALTVPATSGPIMYYTANCARCHGDISAAYEGLAHPKHGEALKQVLNDMAVGPADAPLDETGLAEQVRLHEAMFGKKPYAWLDLNARGVVAGEKLDNTDVSLKFHDRVIAAKVDGYRFALPSLEGKITIESK